VKTALRALSLPVLAVALLAAGGCAETIPKEALQLSHESLEQRQAQTRRFNTGDGEMMLAAAAGVLQDLGFNIDESESRLGLVVASKERDATEAGQVAGAIILGVLTGAYVPIDDKQRIRASLVAQQDSEESEWMRVRVTFQRIVWNTQGQVSKTEGLDDPKLYQEFFSKLSKSVFLEAHEI